MGVSKSGTEAQPCAIPEPCVQAEPRAFVDPFTSAKASEDNMPFNVAEFLAVSQPVATVDAAPNAEPDLASSFASMNATGHARTRTSGRRAGNPSQAGFEPRTRGNQPMQQAHSAI
jgi:hypothetical protein